MRCDRMHATIAVKDCLRNQGRMVADAYQRIQGAKEPWYPGCRGCPTGERARNGELDDSDISAILSGLHARANTPAVDAGIRRMTEGGGRMAAKAKEEAMNEARNKKDGGSMETFDQTSTKICRDCGQEKPLGEFKPKRTGDERRKNTCIFCEREYQKKWARMKRERMSAVKPAMPVEKTEPAPCQETPAPSVPQEEPPLVRYRIVGDDLVPDPDHQLILDFSPYPELLEKIKQIAAYEERDPEVQVRWWLRKWFGQLGPRPDEPRSIIIGL